MQGFVKTSGVAPKQILFCTDPQVSVGVIVSNENIEADTEGKKIVKAGTPLGGSLTNRDVPFEKARAGSVTVNETITTGVENDFITVEDLEKFNTKAQGVDGTYVFTYDNAMGWWKQTSPVPSQLTTMDEYGVKYEGERMTGDNIIGLDFTSINKPVGVLLHDVDVTAGDGNGTLLIFGFVDLNKVDTSVVTTLVAAQSALDGKVYLCK